MQSQHLSGHKSVLLVVVLVFWIQAASALAVDWHLSQVVCAVQRFQEFPSRTSGFRELFPDHALRFLGAKPNHVGIDGIKPSQPALCSDPANKVVITQSLD